MKLHKTLSLAIILLIAPELSAANWYVDALKGNDANAGNKPDKAWQTLAKANALLLEPGDSLFFKAGTQYDGQLKPKGSGRKGKSVFVGAYGSTGDKTKPRFDANGQSEATLHLYNTEWITVSGLELTNKGPERAARRSGALVQANDCGVLEGITLNNLYIHDVNGSLVKKQGGGQGIHIVNGGSEVNSRFENLLIQHCHIQRTERNGIIFDSDYWNRDRWFPNLFVRVSNNLLEEVPGDGIVPLGCDGAVVESNRMFNCTRLLPDGEAAAGIWPWSCDNTVIQYNEVSDHKAPWDAQGFDCDYNCRHTLIQYNYSHDNEGGFLLVCSPSDQRMPWNIGNDSSIIRYNMSVNDGLRIFGKHAGFSPTFHITGPVTNTLIYSNLIIVPKKPEGCDINLVKMDTWGGLWPSGTTFKGNIFHVTDTAAFSFGKDSNTKFRQNVYRGNIQKVEEEKDMDL